MSCTEKTLQCVGINADMALHFLRLYWFGFTVGYVLFSRFKDNSVVTFLILTDVYFFTLKIKSQTTDSVLPVAKSVTVAYTNAILKKWINKLLFYGNSFLLCFYCEKVKKKAKNNDKYFISTFLKGY